MDNKKIGAFIKRRRIEKGLTQQELGELVGVSFKSVSKWECGNSIPNISILRKLCEVLDVSIDELLEGKSNNFKTKNKIIIIILLLVLIIGIVILLNIKNNNNLIENKYDCTLIKTYNIIDINNSNDENYLYVTFKQYQTEGVYTIKLPKTLSKDLQKDKNYEFTFKINKKYVKDNPDIIFSNSELVNISYTDKLGMEQVNMVNCE